MSRVLQLCGYASRAKWMLGSAGDQSGQARSHRSRFYEEVWREAAGELGATFEVLANGICKVNCDGVSTRVHCNYTTLDDPVTLRVALDKPLVHTMLRSHGLPTPKYAEFTLNSLSHACQFLAQYRLCVVKPSDGTGAGNGVTTGIETRGQLLQAAVRAAGYGPRMLVEELVKGDAIRLLYLDGRLLDVVKRDPPTVLGDGESRISQLIQNLNRRRLEAGYELAQAILKHDLDMKRTLARQGLSLRSVPADGQRVVLKGVINDNMADENVTVVDQVSESIIAAGRRAAQLIGVRLAGVDIVTPDLRQGLEEAGGKILEVNASPGFHHHYFKRGGACRVAVPILNACLERTHESHYAVNCCRGA